MARNRNRNHAHRSGRIGRAAGLVLPGIVLTATALATAVAGAATPAGALTPPRSVEAAFSVADGFASYQPGGGSKTPVPVQFDALTLASGGTAAASTLTITHQPASGTASANTTTGIITYSPTSSTTGNQKVTFSLCEAGPTGCQTANLTVGPAVAVNNAFVVPVIGGYASYPTAYAASAPSGAVTGTTFTISFAPAALAVPNSLSLNGVTATVNYLDALDYVLPIPANATYVSGSAHVIGGDANTDSGSSVALCSTTGGTGACTATPVSSTFPTQTTTPYLELQMPSGLHVNGGADVTPPTVVAQFTASGAVGSTIKPQVTEFDAGANVTALGNTISGTLATYPVASSFTSGANPPAYVAYPLSTTTVQAVPPAPVVTGVSPASGPQAGGTSVTISGTSLANASSVTFGGTAAAVTADSATSITATSPAGTGTVDVVVTTPGGTSTATSLDQFTYVPGPAITSISPTTGPTAGGTTVTIDGSNLENANAVDFGSSAGTVSADSTTSITVTSPAGSAGAVTVSVTTPSGTANAPQQFTYVVPPPPPGISGIAPSTGSAAGGTAVTISGSNLANATAVDFGTAAATVTADTATSITATSPPGLGTVSVTVTTLGGTATSPVQFAYTVPPGFPTVTATSPVTGPAAGGTQVTVTGTNLLGASAVDFGGQPASFRDVTATSLTAFAPAGSGTVEVTVTTPAGTSVGTPAGSFTYVWPAPTVSALSPATGPASGWTPVTITGTGFAGVTAVSFGGAGAEIVATGPTALTAIAPPGSGTVAVTVTTPGGTSALVAADQYAYQPAGVPTVSGISATTGPAAGGTSVTVTGTNLWGLTAVDFGGTPAFFSSATTTSVVAVSPAGSGTVDVTVTGPGGTSATSPADQFTYAPALPVVTKLSPASGPASGGTIVTITGTDLGFATAVHFGAAVAMVTGDTTTSLTVRSPAGSGTVDVTVTTPAGTSVKSTADHFVYGATAGAPTLTGISPATGPTTGGTLVKVTGKNLLHTSAVLFGTKKAAFKMVTATSLEAVAPAGTGKVAVRVTTPAGTSKVVTAAYFTYAAAAPRQVQRVLLLP
jgi:hypothetical protein